MFMVENNDNNSFTKRFTNRTPGGTREGFSSKYSSQNTKKRALGERGKNYESGGIKSKSRTVNERSFADAKKRSRSDLVRVYLVRGKDRGKSAWHYVLVDKEKTEMFLAKSRTGSLIIFI